MLEQKISTKYDLMNLLSKTTVKSILARDIKDSDDLRPFVQAIDSMLRSKKRLSLIMIES